MTVLSPVLRLRDVSLGYDRRPAVSGLTLDVAAGSLLAIVGGNGSGKSTIMKGIVGRLKPLSGSIEIDASARGRIAYLPQAAEIDRSFPISVYDMVAMGTWPSTGLFGGIGRRQRDRIDTAIAAVGMTGFEKRPIGSLSGGQMQRVLFARLLLQEAAVILLDEPFTAIDEKTTRDLIGIVRRWHDEGRTVLAVLHDLDLVRETFPETLSLAADCNRWGRTVDVLASATAGTMAARPDFRVAA